MLNTTSLSVLWTSSQGRRQETVDNIKANSHSVLLQTQEVDHSSLKKPEHSINIRVNVAIHMKKIIMVCIYCYNY